MAGCDAASNIDWARTALSKRNLPPPVSMRSSSSERRRPRPRKSLAAGLLAKPEFAPIVLLLLQDAPEPEPAAGPRLAPHLRPQDRPR